MGGWGTIKGVQGGWCGGGGWGGGGERRKQGISVWTCCQGRVKCIPVRTISRGSHPRRTTQWPPLSAQFTQSVWLPGSERTPLLCFWKGNLSIHSVNGPVLRPSANKACQSEQPAQNMTLEAWQPCYLVHAKLLWRRPSNLTYLVNAKPLWQKKHSNHTSLLYASSVAVRFNRTFCNQKYISMHLFRHFTTTTYAFTNLAQTSVPNNPE